MSNLFDSLIEDIVSQIKPICEQLESLPIPERIEALNQIRQALHEVSPFRNEPVDCVLWIQSNEVYANDYNPNSVAPPEMRLLAHSIDINGYTQSIVGCQNGDGVEVVDGYHRTRVGKENKKINKRIHNYLPISIIKDSQTGRNNRIAATIHHNRARGVHSVLPMTDIVAELKQRGWGDDEIAKELGMDADEVLRFKHNSGLPELFKDHEWSRAWE